MSSFKKSNFFDKFLFLFFALQVAREMHT